MDHIATAPNRYVCAACGKTSGTKYGLSEDRSPGWDESCMLNAVLCRPATFAETVEHGWKWHALEQEE